MAAPLQPLIPALLPAVEPRRRRSTRSCPHDGSDGTRQPGAGAVRRLRERPLRVRILYSTFIKDGVETKFQSLVQAPVWTASATPLNSERAGRRSAGQHRSELRGARTRFHRASRTGTASIGVTEQQYIEFSSDGGPGGRGTCAARRRARASLRQERLAAGSAAPTRRLTTRHRHPPRASLTGVDTIWANISARTRPVTPDTTTQVVPNSGTMQCWAYGLGGCRPERRRAVDLGPGRHDRLGGRHLARRAGRVQLDAGVATTASCPMPTATA